MTALVVSIHSLDGPSSFGDYHVRQHPKNNDGDASTCNEIKDDDEGEPLKQSASFNGGDVDSSSSTKNNTSPNLNATTTCTSTASSPPSSPSTCMERKPREDVDESLPSLDNFMMDAVVGSTPQVEVFPFLVPLLSAKEEDRTLDHTNAHESHFTPPPSPIRMMMEEEESPGTPSGGVAVDSSFMSPAPPSPMIEEGETQKQLPLGGLCNLGNTCYLNSALQMVASLDGCFDQLRTHLPATEQQQNDKEEEEETTLRQALVNVLDRLQNGETFEPEAFKQKVDERSSLFIGYRQQDAHEFLTTLLDLVDEDYKQKAQEEQKEEEMNAAAAFENVDDKTASDADAVTEQDHHQMENMKLSPVKKQRLDQDSSPLSETAALPEAQAPSIPTSPSFKELEFQDIENLLHGDGGGSTSVVPRSTPNSCAVGKQEGQGQPKCKLVGGRMSPSGMVLTRWNEGNDVSAASVNSGCAKAMAEDEDSSVEEEETKPFSPVDDYFTTKVRVCLTCESCKYRRSHTETYLHLSLEIGPTIGSIEEGLRAFFKPEKREIKCEKCFCATALQTTEITKLPRALLFHLKRFIVDVSPDYTNISYRKDQSPVSFEPHLLYLDGDQSGALGEVVAFDEIAIERNSRYGIRSVVNHIGSSAACGHYTADAYRILASDDDDDDDGKKMQQQRQWIRFNDAYVSKISQAEAVDTAASTAYMVLYELEPIE